MKRFFLSILFICGVSLAGYAEYAHGRTNNLINADNKLYHFGFILGFNMMDLNVQHSGVVAEDGKVWFVEDTSMNPGFSVGIVSDLRVLNWLNLRFTPTLFFNDRQVSFRDSEGTEWEDGSVAVQSSMLELPLLLKIRGQRKNNYRPYLLAGGALTIDMGRDSEGPLMLKQVDYGIEVGLGFDFYLSYFKLCPELKFYFGLGDVLERDRPEIADVTNLKFSNAISKLTSRLIVLSFNFE